jgi:hypothetical protein
VRLARPQILMNNFPTGVHARRFGYSLRDARI